MKWGAGGINIDQSRIEINNEVVLINKLENWSGFGQEKQPDYETTINTQGRFPANIITDGSEEVTKLFPNNKSTKQGYNCDDSVQGSVPIIHNIKSGVHFGDSGSAARFFYCAKTSPKERDLGLEDFETKTPSECCEDRVPDSAGLKNPRAGAGRTDGHKNNHPTVKPRDLIRYLCQLITPPNGKVLDPFVGSGTTPVVCVELNNDCYACDLDQHYVDIARARVIFELQRYSKQESLI